MKGWAHKPASELAAAVRARKVTSVELVELYLARIAKFNPALNAVIQLRAEDARREARAADEALARGEILGALHGVPATVKESYNVAGLPTCWGVPAFKGNIAREDAVVVERLRQAGAIILGKTNVPLLLADLQSYNDVYGVTNNPWDLTRIPGGSSGGSAVALAAGLTGIEAGSDIGGSLRNPAHFCGVYAHKPSWGIVPHRGHTLGNVSPTDIAAVGPMARSADDIALAIDLIAGPDVWHAPGWKLDLPPPRPREAKDWRIGVYFEDANCPVDRHVTARLRAAADALAEAGAKVEKVQLPVDTTRAKDLFWQLLRGALGGRMPEEQILHFARKAETLDHHDKSYPAEDARGYSQRHYAWSQADEARNRYRLLWRSFFQHWDVVLMPVAPTAAFKHDHHKVQAERRLKVDGREINYLDQIFWSGLVGVHLLPSTAVPVGLSEEKLPVGMQIVGPEYGDRTTIACARLLADQIGGFRAPEGYE
ncbi:MAG: amidase [Alphaproteobacteria bacterium]|nr:amidase [Alphaproteobacteria bacterium]